MYISKIELKNFKRFENVLFELNSNLNILTGENSCGKSSVLDALSIWYASDEFQKLERAFSGQRENKATEYKKLGFKNKKFISFIEKDEHKKASQFLKKSCQTKDIIKYINLKKCFANICHKLELDEMILIDKLVEQLPYDIFNDITDFVYD